MYVKSFDADSEEDIDSIIAGGIFVEQIIDAHLNELSKMTKKDVVLVGMEQGASIALFTSFLTHPCIKAVVMLSGHLPDKQSFSDNPVRRV